MKKNLLTVLILALLIVNIVLTSVMMISVIGTNNKTAEIVNSIAAVLNLELTGPRQEVGIATVPMADRKELTLADMTIPLRSSVIIKEDGTEGTDGKDHYIMFKPTIIMNSAHDDYKDYGETIAERSGSITGTITAVVSNHTLEDCRDDLEGIRAEILESLQNEFQSDFIFGVALSDVKFQ